MFEAKIPDGYLLSIKQRDLLSAYAYSLEHKWYFSSSEYAEDGDIVLQDIANNVSDLTILPVLDKLGWDVQANYSEIPVRPCGSCSDPIYSQSDRYLCSNCQEMAG